MSGRERYRRAAARARGCKKKEKKKKKMRGGVGRGGGYAYLTPDSPEKNGPRASGSEGPGTVVPSY